MPSRIFPFVNGQIYHIYNRGTEKRTIYESSRDYQRFIKSMSYYQIQGPKPKFSLFSHPKTRKVDFTKKIINILSYCLMPNHFHLLIKQKFDGGITEFTGKLSNSYTKYYNTKHKRVGPLFQGEFKSVLVESDEQLIHVSRYIHLNPLVAYLTKDLSSYIWSSYSEYVNNSPKICSISEIMGFFKNPTDYQQFIKDQAGYAVELGFIKHKLLEENSS